jgi:hypothetical protein
MKQKPNVVIFTLSGTPKLMHKPEMPKDLPRFHPLSKAEKRKIAQGVKGLPNLTNAPSTPFLTLTVDHMWDPTGSLMLHWPERVLYPLAHYLNDFVEFQDEPSNNFLVKHEYVEVNFQVQPNRVYMVDFFVAVDTAPVWFEVELCGVTSPPQQANLGGNHLVTAPVYIPLNPGSDWCTTTLRPMPPWSGQGTPPPMSSAGGPWYFIAAEISQFEAVP